jgi:hypothetical protein
MGWRCAPPALSVNRAPGVEKASSSGIADKTSFSLGYTGFGTDGFRINNDRNDHIFDAFAQQELSDKTSIQAELRYRHTEYGDLVLNFFPNDFNPKGRQQVETYTYRAGLRHAFSPDSITLGSFIYQHRDTRFHDEPAVSPIRSIDLNFPGQKSYGGEIQHLFRSRYLNIVGGTGYFYINAEQDLGLTLRIGPRTITVRGTSSEDVNHTNLYLYSYVNFPKNVTFTLGASGDFFHTDSPETESRNQFNPKFGVTWNPFPATTVRAAAFRVLKRTLISDQTLEPTQVAGFNQFFDDLNSTESWRYGLAVDQKFPQNLYGGVELSRRDLEVPFQQVTSTAIRIRRADWNEYLGRAYLLEFISIKPSVAMASTVCERYATHSRLP